MKKNPLIKYEIKSRQRGLKSICFDVDLSTVCKCEAIIGAGISEHFSISLAAFDVKYKLEKKARYGNRLCRQRLTCIVLITICQADIQKAYFEMYSIALKLNVIVKEFHF